jgi:3-(3-hydroxy-phenyl)propionate hydroxylase
VRVAKKIGELPRAGRRIEDPTGLLAQRYDATAGTVYLFRPDQHVCARWRAFDLERVRAAISRATAQTTTEAVSCSTANRTSPTPTASIRS